MYLGYILKGNQSWLSGARKETIKTPNSNLQKGLRVPRVSRIPYFEELSKWPYEVMKEKKVFRMDRGSGRLLN